MKFRRTLFLILLTTLTAIFSDSAVAEFNPSLPHTRVALIDKRSEGGFIRFSIIWRSGGAVYTPDMGIWLKGGWGTAYLVEAFRLTDYDLDLNHIIQLPIFSEKDGSHDYRQVIHYLYKKDRKNVCSILFKQDWDHSNNGTESNIEATLLGCQEINWPK